VSHTYAQNVIHVVFSIKDRRKLMPNEFQPQMWAYATGICKKLDILVLAAGGMEDHIHLLLRIPPTLALAKAVLASIVLQLTARPAGFRAETIPIL
jgi:putative transposase